MMKASLLFVVLIFLVRSASPQEPPAFGNITARDFDLARKFVSSANAVKLIDRGELYYIHAANEKIPYRAMFERRVRIQVMNETGRAYGDVKIPLYTGSNNERLMKVSACTYNLSAGKVTKTMVAKKSIYSTRLNKQWTQTTILFPEVQPGSIIEYKYLVQRKSIAQVKDWLFQAEIPTLYSEYQVRIPANFHFTIHPLASDPVEVKESSFTEPTSTRGATINTTGLQKNFTMRNLAAVTEEPHMGSRKDYLQRLSCLLSEVELNTGEVIGATSTWEEVIADLQADPGYSEVQTTLKQQASTLLAEASNLSRIDRVVFIQSYFKKFFKWNEETSIYTTREVAETFRLKTGNSADLNLLLVNLLRAAGINARPVLVSRRSQGLVNKSLPLITQFNSVLTLVEEGDTIIVLDAKEKHSDHRLVPFDVLHTPGFIVEGAEGRWLALNDSTHSFSMSTALKAEIDTGGVFKGEALLTAADYARSVLNEQWATSKIGFFENTNAMLAPGFQVTNQAFSHVEIDSLPLEMKVNFSMQPGKSGDLVFFPLNFLPGFSENEFTASHRNSDIDFGSLQDHRFIASVVLPANYSFEEVPPAVSLMMPDSSIIFRRFTSTDANVLNVNLTVTFKRFYFTASEYPEFSNFYKLLFAKLAEPVILKRN